MSLEEEKDSSCAEGQEVQTPENQAKEKPVSEDLTKIIEDGDFQDIKDIPEGANDKELYEEVLDKLDIQKTQNNQETQEKFMQENLKKEALLNKLKNLESAPTRKQVENSLSQDFQKIQGLVEAGLINSAQGQNLKKQVLKKAFDKLVQAEKTKRNLLPVLEQNKPQNFAQQNNSIEEFSRNNSDFFTSDGRKEVMNYLKSGNVQVGKDELNKISEIIRIVEKSAIDRYLQKATHEKTLQESNETAKKKLTANAQKTGHNGNLSKTFTREQIGKMSSAEFTKYEPYIMEQLKKGQIK